MNSYEEQERTLNHDVKEIEKVEFPGWIDMGSIVSGKVT